MINECELNKHFHSKYQLFTLNRTRVYIYVNTTKILMNFYLLNYVISALEKEKVLLFYQITLLTGPLAGS